MALERNPEVTAAFVELGHEIACHGWRWISYQNVDEATEREHMRIAVESLRRATGTAPVGWYTGRDSPNTRRLVVEHGGFLYDSDYYGDDLPFWTDVTTADGRSHPHLVVPYTLDTNDMRFATAQGFNSGEQFFAYLRDAFDVLYAEGAERPKMLSIGMHCRLLGRPGRFASLQRFLDHVERHDRVWICAASRHRAPLDRAASLRCSREPVMTTLAQPSGTRIWERCEALARLSEDPDGLTRIFLSKEQRAVNDLTLGWMREAGMSARLDAIGNVVGRYEGETAGAPCLMLGSHLDTVRNAGKYDGMLGVVAAIDCVHTLNARGRRLPFAIEVVGFADEEGVRFGSTLLGSRAIAGTFDREAPRKPRQGRNLDARGADGVRARSRARRRRRAAPGRTSSPTPSSTSSRVRCSRRKACPSAWSPPSTAPIAFSSRSKAWPGMRARCRCRCGAMRSPRRPNACWRSNRAAGASRSSSAPSGRLEAAPGATNVIPGNVRFTIDLRAPSDEQRRRASADVNEAIPSICARRGVKVDRAPDARRQDRACAAWLQQQIGSAIEAEGLPVRRLPSGAGHDGMALVDLVDIGMLFVRCKDGISHNPLEAITVADAELSARVFLRFIEQFKPLS